MNSIADMLAAIIDPLSLVERLVVLSNEVRAK
jgi:hypothetical protein